MKKQNKTETETNKQNKTWNKINKIIGCNKKKNTSKQILSKKLIL